MATLGAARSPLSRRRRRSTCASTVAPDSEIEPDGYTCRPTAGCSNSTATVSGPLACTAKLTIAPRRPPLALVSRGLGEAAVAAGWLLVVVGSDYVQRGAFVLAPLQAGLSYALLVAAILFINEFPDRRGDAAAGKRTLVVRLGPDSAKWVYLGLVLAAYGWLVLMVGRDRLPQGAAAAALTLILSFRAARYLMAHAAEPSELAPALKLTIAAANLHGLVLAATLAFGRWPGVVS